jgi:hypothetical protein
MSKLYNELSDLVLHDSTIHSYLRMQEATGQDDMKVAIVIIRQLAKEKKAYFDAAVEATGTNMSPIKISQDTFTRARS